MSSILHWPMPHAYVACHHVAWCCGARRLVPGCRDANGRMAMASADVGWALACGDVAWHGPRRWAVPMPPRRLGMSPGLCAPMSPGRWACRLAHARDRLGAGHVAWALGVSPGRCARGLADVAWAPGRCRRRLGAWHCRRRPCVGRHPSTPLEMSLGIKFALDTPINL